MNHRNRVLRRTIEFLPIVALLALVILGGFARASYPNIAGGNVDAWDMSTLAAGKVKDFGSGALDLTISGATPTSGICAGAYAFNGISDKMSNAANPLAGLSTTYTIAMYVSKTLTGPFTAYALTFGSGSKAAVYGFTSGKYQLFNGGFSTGIPVSDSNKHWVVWVSSGSGGFLKEYLDGTLINTGGSFALGGSVGAFVVGGSGGADWFGGTFDEVYIYSTALSGTDVANIAPICNAPPTISTTAATSVLCDGAILNGNLTGKGTSNPVAVGFLYSKSPTLAGATNVTASANAAVGVFNKTISGLDASTFYYFRAWANGTDGYATGSILFLETPACIGFCSGNPYSWANIWTFAILIGAAVILAILGHMFTPMLYVLSGMTVIMLALQSFCLSGESLFVAATILTIGVMVILAGVFLDE